MGNGSYMERGFRWLPRALVICSSRLHYKMLPFCTTGSPGLVGALWAVSVQWFWDIVFVGSPLLYLSLTHGPEVMLHKLNLKPRGQVDAHVKYI